jgi:hypothetical protein
MRSAAAGLLHAARAAAAAAAALDAPAAARAAAARRGLSGPTRPPPEPRVPRVPPPADARLGDALLSVGARRRRAAAMAATPDAMAAVKALTAGLPAVVCYHHPCIDGAFAALAAHNGLTAAATTSGAGAGAAGPRSSGGRPPPPPRFKPLAVFKDPAVEDLQLTGREVVYFLDYTGHTGFARRVAAAAARCARRGRAGAAHRLRSFELWGPPARRGAAAAGRGAGLRAPPAHAPLHTARRPPLPRRVVVLDHHKTAAERLGVSLPPEGAGGGGAPQQQEAGGGGGGGGGDGGSEGPLPPNMHVLIDMARSGAVLALDYFGRAGFSPDLLRAFGWVASGGSRRQGGSARGTQPADCVRRSGPLPCAPPVAQPLHPHAPLPCHHRLNPLPSLAPPPPSPLPQLRAGRGPVDLEAARQPRVPRGHRQPEPRARRGFKPGAV